MQLRWTPDAAADLERIADYLFEHSPERAPELVFSLHDAASVLLTFPYRGRGGRKSGTRELVLTTLPYVLIYRVTADAVHVLRILHGARRWP